MGWQSEPCWYDAGADHMAGYWHKQLFCFTLVDKKLRLHTKSYDPRRRNTCRSREHLAEVVCAKFYLLLTNLTYN
jgi:hypothetical protein